jgi:hypothetical protein
MEARVDTTQTANSTSHGTLDGLGYTGSVPVSHTILTIIETPNFAVGLAHFLRVWVVPISYLGLKTGYVFMSQYLVKHWIYLHDMVLNQALDALSWHGAQLSSGRIHGMLWYLLSTRYVFMARYLAKHRIRLHETVLS